VKVFPDLKKDESPIEFVSGFVVRNQVEITEMCDLFYCIHWAVRDLLLKGGASPLIVGSYVVEERRRALEWMIEERSWERITLDT